MAARAQAIPTDDPARRQLAGLANLVQLERKARQAAAPSDLGFVMVNESSLLVPYRQAALWRSGARGGQVAALSGVAAPERDAPFVDWLRRACAHLGAAGQGVGGRGVGGMGAATPESAAIRAVGPADLPEGMAAGWAEWLPPHGLWVPLRRGAAGPDLGGLLLAREQAWTEGDRVLLGYLAEAYGHAWGALLGGRGGRRIRDRLLDRRRWVGAATLAGLVGLGFVPVRQSVLAPAEVIAREPALVRAPFDGVVDGVQVRPNEPVEQGALLLRLDPRRLENGLEVARKAHEVAAAEYRQTAQQAVLDPRSRANLAILQGRMEQHAAEVRYYEDLLARIEVRAPQAGVAIFEDANDWIGKPVAVGERIMTVADPADTLVELRLPVEDAIDLPPGAEVQVFLNVDPGRPVPARVEFHGYKAEPRQDGALAYRLKAAIEPGAERPRLGLKGTAKIYAREVPLYAYLLRRPLAELRRWGVS